MSTTQATHDGNDSTNTLAARLQDALTVTELRRWMPANGIPRERGATKAESAGAAVEADPDAVERVIEGAHPVSCNCGYSDRGLTAEEAEELAREHKSAKPTHFPVARDEEGEAVYGA